jgi:hypothetical protein
LAANGAHVIDLNSATLEQLAALPGMGWAEACELALWRPYYSWADLDIPALACIDVAVLIRAGAAIVPPDTSRWPVGAEFEVSSDRLRDGRSWDPERGR